MDPFLDGFLDELIKVAQNPVLPNQPATPKAPPARAQYLGPSKPRMYARPVPLKIKHVQKAAPPPKVRTSRGGGGAGTPPAAGGRLRKPFETQRAFAARRAGEGAAYRAKKKGMSGSPSNQQATADRYLKELTTSYKDPLKAKQPPPALNTVMQKPGYRMLAKENPGFVREQIHGRLAKWQKHMQTVQAQRERAAERRPILSKPRRSGWGGAVEKWVDVSDTVMNAPGTVAKKIMESPNPKRTSGTGSPVY